MKMSLLLLVGVISWSTVLADNNWQFEGTINDDTDNEKYIKLDDTDEGNAVFHLTSSCENTGDDTSYLQIKLYEFSTLMTVIYKDVICGGESETIRYSEPQNVESAKEYKIQVFGKQGIEFKIKLELEETDIVMEDSEGTVDGTIARKTMLVKTFTLTEEDIKSTSDWSYVEISAESDDKFMDLEKTDLSDKRLVGKMMVTNNTANLEDFYSNPKAALDGAIRLSFSTFGQITLSSASKPALTPGRWLVGVVMDPSHGSNIRAKQVTLKIKIVNDYEYLNRVLILFFVSFLGLIIPMLARAIFDVENVKYEGLKFKYWLETLKNWFWSGKKGLTYLTALLACLLIVSAFQVVHAKYNDMQESGDRDICFYNEKCYRPYGDYYDVSVNGIASNLPFMVQGVILVVYFSISEAYCRSNGHEHFDYSIPYSFGLAFICEGFGSLLYHICPSQIIFQFDTLFMFVISIIMIIAIFEGNSIRECDVRFTKVAKHKAIRTPKVFAFFVGPVYFFNFIGNLIATEGLPVPFVTAFYIVFGAWWIGILLWASYKLDLWPDYFNPKSIPEMPCLDEVDGMEDTKKMPKMVAFFMRHAKIIKVTMFLGYCGVVVAGFVMSLLQMLSFSIFILGALIFGQVILTGVFFIPTIYTVLQHFVNITVQIKESKTSVSKQCLVLLGIVLYVVIGCVVVVISLIFFTVFSVTDKSIYPWRSREQNAECFLNGFYDTHDFWHLFASFALMMMSMVVVQICKPCRECYLQYVKKNKERIDAVRTMSGAVNKLNLTQNAINKFKKPIKTPVTPVADVDNEAGGTEKDTFLATEA
ncbi:uncharacterized protein LOC134824012 isoform X2 [Bolinopsis microptera]|uniref:uncharacterized protein LOC134824012 isoform X2 n=1 Tax=Bolinopsis microptera TaxID=2820187 RepID=UPI00307A61FE